MTKKREVVKFLKDNGFTEKHGASHDKFTKGKVTVTVPRHSEIKDEMFKTIKKQAGFE